MFLENNYYPFGLKHKGYNNVVNSTNVALDWKFNGVEFEEALGLDLYEMEFRSYDAAIGRFTSIDPLAEERNWLTPYNFVQNNPILRVDPSGLLDDFIVNDDGTFTKIAETDQADRVFAADEDGNAIEDQFVTLERDEQIESKTETPIRIKREDGNSRDATATSITFKDENVATEAFEFFSDFSEVEFSLVTAEGSDIFVGTTHSEGSDASGNLKVKQLAESGHTEITKTHSHPRTRSSLLGAAAGLVKFNQRPSAGDIRNAKNTTSQYPGANIKNRVYDAVNSTYYNFNGNGHLRKVPTITRPIKK